MADKTNKPGFWSYVGNEFKNVTTEDVIDAGLASGVGAALFGRKGLLIGPAVYGAKKLVKGFQKWYAHRKAEQKQGQEKK